jgi:hypothetical protein
LFAGEPESFFEQAANMQPMKAVRIIAVFFMSNAFAQSKTMAKSVAIA